MNHFEAGKEGVDVPANGIEEYTTFTTVHVDYIGESLAVVFNNGFSPLEDIEEGDGDDTYFTIVDVTNMFVSVFNIYKHIYRYV